MKLRERRPDIVEVTVEDTQAKIDELRKAWAGNNSKAPGIDRLADLERNLQARILPGTVWQELEILMGIYGNPAVGSDDSAD